MPVSNPSYLPMLAPRISYPVPQIYSLNYQGPNTMIQGYNEQLHASNIKLLIKRSGK